MEIAFKYGIWQLLKDEKIPEIQDLAAIYTGYTCLFKAKGILSKSRTNNLFQNFWF